MAKNVNNNDTLEVLRTSYNDLVDEVGGLGGLRTSQKTSLVDSINSIIDQYFFFQDFEYDGSDGTGSNRTFSGADNFGETLNYSVNRLLVFKNGTLLRSGTDYNASNGTSVVLTSSAANSDIIRITSFTGSYEGVAGATQAATTQWTKTGGGSIFNHDTESGVVINSDDSGIVTTPASGVGVQIESSGSNIFLNTGGTSNKVEVNGNLNLVTGGKITVNDGNVGLSNFEGLQAAVRGALSASGDISYNSSTGVISFSQAGAPVTSVFGRTGAVGLTLSDVTGVMPNTGSLSEGSNLYFTNERVDDRVNALIQAGTNITTSYDDAAGTLTINTSGKTQEEIEDIVGAMFSGNTESGLSVTYQDSDGTLDLDVDDFTITLTGDVTGAGTVTNLGNVSFATTIAANSVALGTDTTGNYVGALVAGTALSSTGATSGEGIAHTLSLDNTAVTAGSYGSASAIPTFTVDAQGRLTAAGSVSVDTYSGFEFGTSSSDKGTVNETENVFITAAGSLNAEHTESSGTHTLALSIDDATTSAKGVASFNSTDFNVSSGAVSLVHEHIEDIVGGMLTGGGATTVSYNDATGSVTISSTDTNTDTNTQRTDEEIQDIVGAMISGSGATSVSYNDSAGTISISSTDTNTDTNTTNFNIQASGNASTNISAGETINYTGSGATTVTRSGNTITIASTDTNTDTNTQYSAGTGISLSGTTFSIGQPVATTSTVTFGEVRSSGDITAFYSSDYALKENINPISNALDKVSQLGGYNFDWKDSHIESRGGIDNMFVKKSDVGIIAQEVQKVLPEAVGERKDGTLGVRYELLVPLLVESIKELKSEIESLKS